MQLLFEMSICSVLLYGLFVMLYEGKNNHQFNRIYLLISLLLTIAFPLLDLPIFPKYVVAQIGADSPLSKGVAVGEESSFFNWESGLLVLWLAGLVLNMFFLLKNLFALAKIIRNSEKKLEQNHCIVFTRGEMAVSSFLNYLFIPKEQEQSISDYEIQHELTHIRQRHSIDILFVESLKAFFWFNPVIYLYKKRIIEIHEFLADQHTSNELGEEAYKAFLIHQITTRQQVRLVHNFYSLFKKRLVMMQSNVSLKSWQYWAILPAFLVCFALFSCENYKIQDKKYSQTYPLIPNKINDSIINYEHDITDYPSIPPELVGENIDTIFTFDPETQTVSVHYEKYNEQNNFDSEKSHPFDRDGTTGIDTIIIFDPADYSETVIVINHDTGETDTLQ